jgi:hypothetical protein
MWVLSRVERHDRRVRAGSLHKEGKPFLPYDLFAVNRPEASSAPATDLLAFFFSGLAYQ